MPQYIREGRFGPPKSQKTRMICGTYPKPMLVLEFDQGGMTVDLKPYFTGAIVEKTTAEVIAMSTAGAELPGITWVNLADNKADLTELYVPRPDSLNFPNTVKIINSLKKSCPWKTIVIDTVTGLSDSIYGHQAVTNTAALVDPRKWAGNIGMKVKQVIDVLQTVPAHTVTIFHEETDKNEITSEVRTMAMVYSKLREFLGAMFDQYVQANADSGKPVIRTKSTGLIKGIGLRWPSDLPDPCPADFNSIYGKVIKV